MHIHKHMYMTIKLYDISMGSRLGPELVHRHGACLRDGNDKQDTSAFFFFSVVRDPPKI